MISNDPTLPSLIHNNKQGLLVYKDPHFYTHNEATQIFKQLNEDVVYDKKSTVVIFGKKHLIPRKQSGYGDDGTTYSFSGVTVNAKPWIPILLKIKSDIEHLTDKQFNFCLVNYYADGDHYIGYHKDDERDLGPAPWIVSLSFGATRKFYFKSDNKSLPVVKTSLNHGCLCIMIHPTNKKWKHSVPKEKHVKYPRINLTFRQVTQV